MAGSWTRKDVHGQDRRCDHFILGYTVFLLGVIFWLRATGMAGGIGSRYGWSWTHKNVHEQDRRCYRLVVVVSVVSWVHACSLGILCWLYGG